MTANNEFRMYESRLSKASELSYEARYWVPGMHLTDLRSKFEFILLAQAVIFLDLVQFFQQISVF